MGLSPKAMAEFHESGQVEPSAMLASPELGTRYYPAILNGVDPDKLAHDIDEAYANRSDIPGVEVELHGSEVKVTFPTKSYVPGQETAGSPMPPMYERTQKVTATFGVYGLYEIIHEDISAPDAPGFHIPTHGVRFEPFHGGHNQTLFEDDQGDTYMLPGRETTFVVNADGSRETMTIREMQYVKDGGQYVPATPTPAETFHQPDDERKSQLLYPMFPSEKSPYGVVMDAVAELRAMQARGVAGVDVHEEDGHISVVAQYVRNGSYLTYKYVLNEQGHAVFYQYWWLNFMADPGARARYVNKELPSESLFEQEEQEGGLQVSRRLKIIYESAQTPTDYIDGQPVYGMVPVKVDERYTNHQLQLADGRTYDISDVTREVYDDQGKIADQHFDVERDLFRPLDTHGHLIGGLQYNRSEDVLSLGDKGAAAVKDEGARFVRIFYRGRTAAEDLAIHLHVVREDPNDPNSPLVCELDGDHPFEMTPREREITWVV